MLKLANSLFLLGSLRLSLSANAILNLWGLFLLLFSVLMKTVSKQIFIDCFIYFEGYRI